MGDGGESKIENGLKLTTVERNRNCNEIKNRRQEKNKRRGRIEKRNCDEIRMVYKIRNKNETVYQI